MASSSIAGTSGAKESSLTTLVLQLEERSIPHFYKVMSRLAVTETVRVPFAYCLAFPMTFVRAHGTNFDKFVVFLWINDNIAWPIEITGKTTKVLDHPIFAYGSGGWKDFVMDNESQVGDTLVFSLVGFSHFVIDIIKASPVLEEEAHDHEEDAVENSIEEVPVLSKDDALKDSFEEIQVPSKRRRKAGRRPRRFALGL